MNCYRVKVKTTNSSLDTTYAPGGEKAGYVKCSDSTLYVFGNCFADAEKVVDGAVIESIELTGLGYCA